MSVLAELFLRPHDRPDAAAPEPGLESAVARSSAAARVAVVGRDRWAIAAGCAVGLALARRDRGAAIVAVSAGDIPGGWRAAPARAARVVAERLRTDGVEVSVAGRLVLVPLDADGADVAWAAIAARPVAAVLVVAGPRDPVLEPALASCDVAGVVRTVGDFGTVDELALAALPPGSVVVDAVHGVAAALAVGGVAVLPALGRGVAALVEAVGR